MKKAFLLLLLAMCCLILTACYTDHDPFPAANELGESQATMPPTVTVVPATEAPATQPPATAEPLPEDAVDISPNFNG